MKKDLSYYLSLKYPTEIREDEDGAFVVTNPDLPGCVSFGDTIQEAVDNLSQVRQLWIGGRFEAGEPVPEPSEIGQYSGKFVLRLPRWLHQSLDQQAKRESVSLNSYVCSLLAERNAFSGLEQSWKALLHDFTKHPRHPEVAVNDRRIQWKLTVGDATEDFYRLQYLPIPQKKTTLTLPKANRPEIAYCHE